MNLLYTQGTFIEPAKPAFIIDTDHRGWFKNGIPEGALIDWCRTLITKEQNFIDVGANIGTYTVGLSPHCKHVYSFEPQSKSFYGLCGNIYLNKLTNVTPYHMGLSSQPGEATLKIICENGGGSSISNLPHNQTPMSTEIVELATLDSLNIQNVGLIKVDVEGHELDVLKGAVETIAREHPKLIFEAWSNNYYKDEFYATNSKLLCEYIVNELGYKTIRPLSGAIDTYIADF